jgi:ATP-dependent Clp protease protease subunit
MNVNDFLKELSDELMGEKFLKTRNIAIFGEINQRVAMAVTEKLILLSEESDKVIKIIINSQGGHVESADTIFDMINYISAPVKTIGTGWVASAGTLIFSAPPKKQRYCLPNTRFLIHQPSGGIGGQATDISIEAREIIKTRERLNKILAGQTGQPIEKIRTDTDRNFWMTAEEAKEYGLVGHIIKSLTELEK